MKRPWLAPLMPLYAAGSELRALWMPSPRRLARPVVSVGNISVGGAGKTPFVMALAKLLERDGLTVDILSRGYGRQSSAPARVLPEGTAEAYGDEPLMMARETGLPVFVASQRLLAGQLAERECEAAVHLLDDGFQHRPLHRDFDLVLVSEVDWRDGLLPAGNLREPLSSLARASAFAVAVEEDELAQRLAVFERPVWRYRRRVRVPDVAGPAVAFCGLARPEQFFRSLKDAGVESAACIAFRDHHRFCARDLQRLAAAARQAAATAFVTTLKDRVRLGALADELEQVAPVVVAELTIKLEDAEDRVAELRAALRC